MKVVELIRIIIDEADSDGAFYWNTGDEDIDHDGDTYEPYPVTRGGITQNNELNRAKIQLTIPPDSALAQTYHGAPPDRVASVTVFRKQDDTVLTYWKGRISAVRSGDWETVIECESIYTSMRRTGARARYQIQCRHALYGRGCNLDKASFATAANVTAVSGKVLTVTEAASQDDGYWIGGMVEFGGVSRFIVGHSGTSITLWRDMPDLTTGAVTLYPGCDRSLATCTNKFSNAVNHGGFPWLPNTNPFSFVSLW